ncbi:MAG TPA: hypothetical protein VK689_05840 [Armatimonadota bacterium]|nr:hypothetical protein [Armatimonadota bacterium]
MHTTSHSFRALGACAALVLLALGACRGDRGSDSGELTAVERAAFKAPADSGLTVKQVDAYLRTTLAQLELLRKEGPAMRAQLAVQPRQPAQSSAVAKGPRPKSRQALWGDFVDAAFIRSARKLRYAPAELLYVRHRISAVSGHLLAGEMHASRDDAAALFRQQAQAMRGTPGVSQAQVDAMLQAAEQAERQTARTPDPRLEGNLDVLRQAHAGVGDAGWGSIASVASGVGITELGEAPDAEFTRRLDELRQLHLEALENRAPPRR